MVKSMTGYGRCRKVLNNRDITVELKSVNNRFLDCNIKLPRAYIFAEDSMKTIVQQEIARGKVDVFVTIDTLGSDDVVISVNESLAKEYYNALLKIDSSLNINSRITAIDISKMPDVMVVTKAEEDIEQIACDICQVLKEAINAFNDMREVEGSKLKDNILEKADFIEKTVEIIEVRSPECVKEYRERLTNKMMEVLNNTTFDETRIIQEAAIYADKIAVDEETVRLHSHLNQLRTMLQSSEPIGRKLDFLIQEVNRECNTIGSKCNDIEIAQDVVNMKSEVEKIREQVQNLE